ncbi:MAG: glycosyltransferase [Phycisphaerales bacterium]
MISFVIPAHNEQTLIGRTIRAIHGAAQPLGIAYEVVVADDDSDDATGQIAQGAGARVVRVSHRQIAATRNAGARASGGNVLIFVDADTVVTARAVRDTVRAMERGATYGGAEIRWDGRVPLWTTLILRMMLIGYERFGFASGAYLYARRDAFEAVGGFDETLFAGEEIDVCQRLGRRGRHAWVRTPVYTSGRKLRTFSFIELLGATGRLAVLGRRGVSTRESLDLWYGPRREDPAGVPDVCPE